jgi:DNA-binding transcriptional ArsR family regulator
MSPSPPVAPPVAPSIDVQDPRALRALAHPLRGRLLGVLRLDGPATATQLGYRLGESSGSTSYHLRQLAAYGFVEDMPGEGNGRERWWRALHRSTHWETADFLGDPAAREVVDELLLQQVDQRRRVLAAYIDQRRERSDDWEPAGSLNDYAMRMRPDDAVAMAAELTAVLARWSDATEPPSTHPQADGDADGDPDTGLVLVHLDVLPLSEYPL